MKKIQIGVRVNEEDAEFLNLLEINGAKTPSDKLRAIIKEARMRSEYSHDFSGLYKMLQEQLTPLVEKIKKAEFEMSIHSALIARIVEWIPEFYAFCLCSLSEEGVSKEELSRYEKGVVDRVARLFESLLHLEISAQDSGYDPDVLKKHICSVAEIIKIIDMTSQKKEG